MRTSDFLTGVFIGGILGAAAALLYTPAPGKTLRAQARDYIDNVRQEVRQAATTRRVELEQELATLKTPPTQKTPQKSETETG
jgi:gas vesicle protein